MEPIEPLHSAVGAGRTPTGGSTLSRSSGSRWGRCDAGVYCCADAQRPL